MSQGVASLEEAIHCAAALEDILKAFPKSKIADFRPSFNDIFLFLSQCRHKLKSEKKK